MTFYSHDIPLVCSVLGKVMYVCKFYFMKTMTADGMINEDLLTGLLARE